MLALKSVFLLVLFVELALGLGYVVEGEYHAIPENAQLVFEAPEVPIANSPLNTNDDQLTRTARDRAWRHIGLGKRSTSSRQRNLAMMGLGRK